MQMQEKLSGRKSNLLLVLLVHGHTNEYNLVTLLRAMCGSDRLANTKELPDALL